MKVSFQNGSFEGTAETMSNPFMKLTKCARRSLFMSAFVSYKYRYVYQYFSLRFSADYMFYQCEKLKDIVSCSCSFLIPCLNKLMWDLK